MKQYPHSLIYPFAGRHHGDPAKKGPALCEKCGLGEASLPPMCFLATRPGEDRKRHRKAFEQGL